MLCNPDQRATHSKYIIILTSAIPLTLQALFVPLRVLLKIVYCTSNAGMPFNLVPRVRFIIFSEFQGVTITTAMIIYLA